MKFVWARVHFVPTSSLTARERISLFFELHCVIFLFLFLFFFLVLTLQINHRIILLFLPFFFFLYGVIHYHIFFCFEFESYTPDPESPRQIVYTHTFIPYSIYSFSWWRKKTKQKYNFLCVFKKGLVSFLHSGGFEFSAVGCWAVERKFINMD